MEQIRRGSERGFADHGWLRSYHSFSFADYFDPRHVEFGPLRVINEDRVDAGAGFGTHGHRDMEIISYVLSGQLSHKDSMGNGSTMQPGDVQRMSAGTGVQHSEFNPSKGESVHFLQIWIQPNARGIRPGYEQKHFSDAEKRGRLCLIASPDGAGGSVLIHQDAYVYATLLDGAEQLSHAVSAGRRVYVHVVRGIVTVNGKQLQGGDALMLEPGASGPVTSLQLAQGQNAEILVFDLP
jgi:redox-sensitive bicupin YhaK (pirin superfamily)